jgi:hypothetical protein
MRRLLIFLVVFILLVANLPWFFSSMQKTHILGFPPWAFYSLIMMVAYGVVTAFFLGRYWDDLSDPGEENGDGTRNRSKDVSP